MMASIAFVLVSLSWLVVVEEKLLLCGERVRVCLP